MADAVTEVMRVCGNRNKRGNQANPVPGCVPSPRVQRQTFYCMLVKAWQAAVVATGTLPERPGL